jgi:O-antigen ligase
MVHAVLFSGSRGGMLGLVFVGLAAFIVIPKGPKEYWGFALAIVLILSRVGPEVQARFLTSFAGEGQRDSSAVSRLDLWAACLDQMVKNPILGVGPDHMPLLMDQYGYPKGKEAHTLWLQIGAELGFPGLLALGSYYGFCLIRLWPIARGRRAVPDPWLAYLARMVVASLVGFVVSAQFVSLEFLETPYYSALVGAGVLKLADTWARPPNEA